MSNYGIFARFYDRLTQNAEYKVRSEYISGFFNTDGRGVNTVLDVACGTGTVAANLSELGFKVTGIDLSEDMLSVASSKCNAEFLKCDMRNFNFENRFDAAICTLDSLNHLESLTDWERCFKSVYNSLCENGVFIFDVNTVYKHNVVLADNTFVFDDEDFFLSWDNELLGDNKVRIMLDFFIFNGKSYDRFSEEFIETAYTVEEIIKTVSPYFKIEGIYGDLTKDAPAKDCERMYFICRRK